MKNPLVTVVMPVYNYEKYLAIAIQSIIDQTYTNWEMIIINDGSTDLSSSIIKTYRRKYPKKIKVITNRKPMGYGGESATNKAIRLAEGKYIAKMDADDISVQERLEKQVRFLEKHPNVFMVGGQAKIIDAKGKIIGERRVPLKHEDIYKEFYLRSCVIHPLLMFRNTKQKDDFYKLKFAKYNDYYTFFKLMSEGKKFYNLPDYLLYYRNHGKNSVYVNIKSVAPINMMVKQSFVKEFGYRPNIKNFVHAWLQYIVIMTIPDKLLLFLLRFKKNM